jgi:hypothetical protein
VPLHVPVRRITHGDSRSFTEQPTVPVARPRPGGHGLPRHNEERREQGHRCSPVWLAVARRAGPGPVHKVAWKILSSASPHPGHRCGSCGSWRMSPQSLSGGGGDGGPFRPVSDSLQAGQSTPPGPAGRSLHREQFFSRPADADVPDSPPPTPAAPASCGSCGDGRVSSPDFSGWAGGEIFQWSSLSWFSLPRSSTPQPILRNAGARRRILPVAARASLGQSFGGIHSPPAESAGLTSLSSAADVPVNASVTTTWMRAANESLDRLSAARSVAWRAYRASAFVPSSASTAARMRAKSAIRGFLASSTEGSWRRTAAARSSTAPSSFGWAPAQLPQNVSSSARFSSGIRSKVIGTVRSARSGARAPTSMESKMTHRRNANTAKSPSV